jgi:hypothetical protein
MHDPHSLSVVVYPTLLGVEKIPAGDFDLRQAGRHPAHSNVSETSPCRSSPHRIQHAVHVYIMDGNPC